MIPSLRTLSHQDLLDLVNGSAIFSAGGGGDPVEGHKIVDKLVSEGYSTKIIAPTEVPDDARVVNFACVGATTSIDYDSDAALKVLRTLEEHANFSSYAMIPVELGGFNTLVAIDVAARCGIPIVDGDGAGRSVPEVHLKVYTIDNISLTPMVVADLHAKNIVVVEETTDPKAGERIARILATEWNHCAYTARRILSGVQVKNSPIQLSLSKSIRVGQMLRVATNPINAILEETQGLRLFEGTVEYSNQKTDVGFTFVDAMLRGTHEFIGSTFELKVKNEVLVAFRDGRLIAIAPDIITPTDLETGICHSAEKLKKGDNLTFLGLPAPQKWRTNKGLELWKDVLQRAEIFEEYIPLKRLQHMYA